MRACPDCERVTGNREIGNTWNSSVLLTNKIADSVGDDKFADHSRCAPYGGVLLACQGKFPIYKLEKPSQFVVLLLKHFDPEPQCCHDILSGETLAILQG